MKKLLTLIVSMWMLHQQVTAQQVSLCPLSLPFPAAFPACFSTPSHDVMWVSAQGVSLSNSKIFARTINQGAGFIKDTIPEPMDRGCSSIYALDSNTAWVAMTDMENVNDGGMNWTP